MVDGFSKHKQDENVSSRRYTSSSKVAKFLKYTQDVFMKKTYGYILIKFNFRRKMRILEIS